MPGQTVEVNGNKNETSVYFWSTTGFCLGKSDVNGSKLLVPSTSDQGMSSFSIYFQCIEICIFWFLPICYRFLSRKIRCKRKSIISSFYFRSRNFIFSVYFQCMEICIFWFFPICYRFLSSQQKRLKGIQNFQSLFE